MGAFHDFRPFDVELLLLPAIVIFISLFVLGYRGSKSVLAAWLIATIKTSFFILYFGFFFDGTYTSVDDEYYLITGEQIANLFVNHREEFSVDQLQAITGGMHILYSTTNAVAFLIFGEFYFSPIVFNIIIGTWAALIGARLLNQQKILRDVDSRYFFVFFCLHPELVSWSTVFNGKDTFVLFMNVLLLQAASLYLQRRMMMAFLSAAIATSVLFALRFYVPVIFSASFLIYLIIDRRLSVRKLINLGVVAALVLFFIVPPWELLNYSLDIYKTAFINPITGAIHFMLTPRPFFTDEIHQFLDLASLFDWILFPILVFGAYVCFRLKNEFGYLLLIYLGVFVLFYGGFYDLNGPRHRLQLLFAISAFQFIGLYWLIRRVLVPQKLSYPTSL